MSSSYTCVCSLVQFAMRPTVGLCQRTLAIAMCAHQRETTPQCHCHAIACRYASHSSSACCASGKRRTCVLPTPQSFLRRHASLAFQNANWDGLSCCGPMFRVGINCMSREPKIMIPFISFLHRVRLVSASYPLTSLVRPSCPHLFPSLSSFSSLSTCSSFSSFSPRSSLVAPFHSLPPSFPTLFSRVLPCSQLFLLVDDVFPVCFPGVSPCFPCFPLFLLFPFSPLLFLLFHRYVLKLSTKISVTRKVDKELDMVYVLSK